MKGTPLQHPYFYLPFEFRPEFDHLEFIFPRGGSPPWLFAPSYPSPPMSSPPSPQRKESEEHPPSATAFPELTSAGSATTSSTGSAFSIPPVLAGIPVISHQSIIQNPFPSRLDIPRTFSSSSSESQSAIYRTESASSASNVPDPQPTAGPSTGASSATVGQAGRRAKSHVANACNNCKRAHLSCDVDRPCGRCVATGKSDTCHDVPHKKRGRPRLRDEGQFQIQQAITATETAESVEAGPSTVASRPMARGGHRRTGSLRTLRANAGEFGAQPSTPTMSTMSSAQGSLTLASPQLTGYAPPPMQPRLAPSPEVPIAFLDTDFVILKANTTFQRLFSWLQEIRGIRLSDIARPIERDSFQNARNRLREEREIREPAYLPPILQPRLDPVSGIGITDHDVEEVTRGFNDHQFAWTFRLGGGIDQTLPVRMRLAKTSVYFVTLFLPPLPPQTSAEQVSALPTGPPPVMFPKRGVPPPPPPPPPFQSSPRIVDREHPGISEPPTAYYPFPTAGAAGFVMAPGARPYPPADQQMTFPHPQYHQYNNPFLQQPQQMLPPPPSLGTSGERPGTSGSGSSTGYQTFLPPLPQTRPRSETMESLGRHVQTRLRADSGATVPFQSSPIRRHGQGRRESSDDDDDDDDDDGEDDEESPKKRRRLDINEMLQR